MTGTDLIAPNNVGSIRYSDANDWVGQTGQRNGFCAFDTVENCVRAMSVLIQNYQARYRARDGSAIDTVSEIVTRWAPPEENDTALYIRNVLKWTGIERGTEIDTKDYDQMRRLLPAIVRMECGVILDPATVDRALARSGVEVPPKPKRNHTKTKAMKGGNVAALAGVGTVAVHTAEQAGIGTVIEGAVGVGERVMPFFKELYIWSPYILGAVVVVAAAYVIYDKLIDNAEEDHLDGLR